MGGSRFTRLVRAIAVAGMVTALTVAFLGAAIAGTALGDEDAAATGGCEVIDLGTLAGSADAVLGVQGRWRTGDCESRFRAGSDAHTFRFHVAEAGRVRISLTSEGADSYLYLLTSDGGRITGNDDNGAGLDARVERDLAAGVYLVEATTVGGRSRGPADFELTVSRVEGCGFVHLGTLAAGTDLTASGIWSLETCGSRFVSSHPAYNYTFDLAEPAVVRIDLESDNGDPVLSLASLGGGIIGADDDGGHRRNARIEQYLQPGAYFVEATTYFARDYQPLRADFALTVRLVDEQARQQGPHLKVEAVHTPEVVVAGDPFWVHYRVGNIGGSDLPDDGTEVWIYLFGQAGRDNLAPLSGIWDAGAAYHTSEAAANSTSTQIDAVRAFEATTDQHGPRWVFIGAYTDNPDGVEVAFHGIWHNLVVHSGPTFGPVNVAVGFSDYTVTANAGSEGLVTISVASVTDPDTEVGARIRPRAIYAAGVLTQLLEGVFERPALTALAAIGEQTTPQRVRVADPSSSTLLELFAQQYAQALRASGLTDAWSAREAINPAVIDKMLLNSSETAASQYAYLVGGWRNLLDLIEDGDETLSFRQAVTIQSQLAYAESILAPAVTAGNVVTTAAAADEGWDDPDVGALMAELSGCAAGPDALRGALETAGITEIDETLALDAEMRSLRPIHGLAVDSALCATAAADAAASRFMQRLSLNDETGLLRMLGLDETAPQPTTEPTSLRVVARLDDDGRLEHGVDIEDSGLILPQQRYMPADSRVNVWHQSSNVELDGDFLGHIRSRRLADGRVELGFVGADGVAITPDRALLPARLPADEWLYTSKIKIPATVTMEPVNPLDN